MVCDPQTPHSSTLTEFEEIPSNNKGVLNDLRMRNGLKIEFLEKRLKTKRKVCEVMSTI